jgi:hypothetical protein
MADPLSDKIKKTQNSFPPQKPGSVIACPLQKAASTGAGSGAAPAPSAVEVKTDFNLTQKIMKSMTGSKIAEKPKEKKAWVEIILVDAEGNPVPGVKYRITPPGGAPVEGRLNEHGQAGVYGIEPGSCKITFPDLDKDAWE